MLDLKKFIRRVATNHPDDDPGIKKLIAMLPDYGDAGIDRLIQLILDEAAPEIARANAIVVLGVERSSVHTGRADVQACLEKAALTLTSELVALMAFTNVYACGLYGKPSAGALVEMFRTGTPAQQKLFKEVDSQFTENLRKAVLTLRVTETGRLN